MINRHTFSIRYLFSAIVIFGLFFPGCTDKKTENKQTEHRIPVITGKVSVSRVEYILNQVGTLKANQKVTLRSEIEGPIIEILFSEGSDVKKNEALVKLDPAKIQAELRNLKARIEQLQIGLANKKRTLERKRPLVDQDLVSRIHFDDLQTDIKEMDSQILQARADLARQNELLSDTVIRAPFDGVVGVRDICVGDYLKVGDPVVGVVDLDPLQIVFQVPEKFKPDLFVGKQVLLTVDPYPDRIFKGQISFIAPAVDINTRSFQVKALVNNNESLLNPGMFARAKIIMEVHENALTVPWESVIQTEEEAYIYIVEKDVARKVPVKLGKITGKWAEVLDSGIAPGAIVILEGKFAAKDGMNVSVK
ncbi:MAG: efflux RND transporter periplasmic adaptor subunit [Thermodesulfobacteriota bacterium]|nr:efflux RND transporter periplasmic adaptor subunit [Thermodesulfobacteriota bacterium]